MTSPVTAKNLTKSIRSSIPFHRNQFRVDLFCSHPPKYYIKAPFLPASEKFGEKRTQNWENKYFLKCVTDTELILFRTKKTKYGDKRNKKVKWVEDFDRFFAPETAWWRCRLIDFCPLSDCKEIRLAQTDRATGCFEKMEGGKSFLKLAWKMTFQWSSFRPKLWS